GPDPPLLLRSFGGQARAALRCDGALFLELRICLQHDLADAILRGRIAIGRPQQREAAALAVDRVGSRRERDVAPAPAAALPHGEADELQAVEHAFGEVKFRVGKLAWRVALVVARGDFDEHGVLHGPPAACARWGKDGALANGDDARRTPGGM